MKKNGWQSVAEIRDWKKESISDPGVLNFLNKVLSYADEMHKFYFDNVGGHRCWSVVIRIITIISISITLFLSLLLGVTDDKNEMLILSLDFGALALASISLLTDRIFGFSEGWMRYMQTKFEIEKIVADYHMQILKLSLDSEINASALSKDIARLDIFLNFDKSLRQIIIEETSGWSLNLRSQINALTSKVDSDLSASRLKVETITQKIKKERDAEKQQIDDNQKNGVLIIEILYNEISSGVINFNNKKYTLGVNQNSKVITDIDQGIYSLVANIKIKDKIVHTETALIIKSGINNCTIGNQKN